MNRLQQTIIVSMLSIPVVAITIISIIFFLRFHSQNHESKIETCFICQTSLFFGEVTSTHVDTDAHTHFRHVCN